MRDIGPLLADASRGPYAPLDINAVFARADSLRRTRAAALVAAAVVAAAVPAAGLLKPSPGDEQLVPLPAATQPVPDAGPTASPTAGSGTHLAAPPDDRYAPSSRSGPARHTTATTATAGPAATAVPAPVSFPTRSSAPAQASDYPARESCRVESSPVDLEKSCRFTATHRGGFRAVSNVHDVEWEIVVVGDDGTEVFRNDLNDPWDNCRELVIFPGDQVTVTVRRTAFEAAAMPYVGAGRGYGCGGSP